MWTLEQALTLVRTLQPQLHEQKYHVALGGGVLNNGASDKDLDLYLFPFDNATIPPITPFLETVLGVPRPMIVSRHPDSDYPPDVNFDTKMVFTTPDDKRIDVFITKNGVA